MNLSKKFSQGRFTIIRFPNSTAAVIKRASMYLPFKLFCGICIFLCFCQAAQAQYRFDRWTTDDGLRSADNGRSDSSPCKVIE